MANLLTGDQLTAALADLPGWVGDASGITRSFVAQTFPAAIALVNAVAEAAERANHHPDIDIRWTRVTFALSTHSAGGVTDLDAALAREVDAAASRTGAEPAT
jgi:4a-hydroxytetrahydrobiopterin dehydratase